jgi:hypothetical protein
VIEGRVGALLGDEVVIGGPCFELLVRLLVQEYVVHLH